MLEVVFSDSAKGAMKAATKYKLSKEISKDVVCIGINLDVGDIVNEIDSQERKNEFVRVFGSVNFKESEIDRFFNMQRKDFEKLLAYAKKGEPIRVWKSNAPFSACGFALVCDALRNIECKICTISLPEYWNTTDGTIQSGTDWADLPPDQLNRFLPLERPISNIEKHLQSDLWNDLKSDNAPLRALVNGRLVSVPEDFYDHIIMKNIPDREFVMVQLIGTILGKYPFGVGDGWYALRIKKMITENTLEIVSDEDSSHPYGKMLRKVTTASAASL